MKNRIIVPNQTTTAKVASRRGLLRAGLFGAAGVAATATVPLLATRADAQRPSQADRQNDISVLNNALFFEHQAIWAYGVAAGKLSETEVGKTVKALALRNQADHMRHRDALSAAVRSLGGMPAVARSSYDVSSYIQAGEGNLDSDVNIAKLALALETDAAIAYTTEIAKLKTPALITAGASIGTDESAHATAIRAAFKALGVAIEYVPASFVSADTRREWVLKV